MKEFRITKITAAVCAAMMCLTLFAGCDNGSGEADSGTTASQTSESGETKITLGEADLEAMGQEIITDVRPLEEGDDYAINKINTKSPVDALPGGYVLQDYTEENQGKLYLNGKSEIIIRAYNYKEDLQAMEIWAENACALMALSNMTYAQDTVYEDPENVKICGFDGIKYDYQKIQYDFLPDENNPDAGNVKTEIFRFNARAYFFYSEQDAYVVMFDTLERDWDEQVALFEEFVADLEVTKTEY